MKNKRYLVTLIVYGTAIVLLMMLQGSIALGWFDNLSDQALEVIGSVVPQIVIMLGIPLVMLLTVQKIAHEPVSLKDLNQEIGWRKMPLKNVLACLAVGVCVYILNVFVASIFGSLLQSFGYQFNHSDNVFEGYWGLIISLVLTAVLPGICEEFLHRGVLLSGLLKQYGVHRALLWSSVLFGLMHMNVGQFFYASILGWFMGVTVLTSGSLWGSIIIHFTNNALATYFSYAEDLKLPGANLMSFLFGNPVALILTLLIVFVIIGELLRWMARNKFSQNLDSYTVRYLSSQNHFNVEDFDRVKGALPRAIQTMPTWKAISAYIETFEQPKTSRPLERALFTVVVLMGTALTVLSFVWGTW